MKDLTNTSNELVAQIFADYHQSVFFYIYKKIGKKEDVVGMFRRFKFDITDYIQPTQNCIAIKIFVQR